MSITYIFLFLYPSPPSLSPLSSFLSPNLPFSTIHPSTHPFFTTHPRIHPASPSPTSHTTFSSPPRHPGSLPRHLCFSDARIHHIFLLLLLLPSCRDPRAFWWFSAGFVLLLPCQPRADSPTASSDLDIEAPTTTAIFTGTLWSKIEKNTDFKYSHPIIHCPTSEGVSERANE